MAYHTYFKNRAEGGKVTCYRAVNRTYLITGLGSNSRNDKIEPYYKARILTKTKQKCKNQLLREKQAVGAVERLCHDTSKQRSREKMKREAVISNAAQKLVAVEIQRTKRETNDTIIVSFKKVEEAQMLFNSKKMIKTEEISA